MENIEFLFEAIPKLSAMKIVLLGSVFIIFFAGTNYLTKIHIKMLQNEGIKFELNINFNNIKPYEFVVGISFIALNILLLAIAVNF